MMSVLAASLILFPGDPVVQQEDNRYLEIPMKGKFGIDITAAGVEAALKEADSLRIRHVVFTLNSRGGSHWAAHDIYNVLRQHDRAFRYYAMVREATGVALSVVVWCDEVFICPGGRVGGDNLVIEAEQYPGIDRSVVLLNLALSAGEDAKRHGRSASLVRAMMDPAEPAIAWKDSEGKVRISSGTPTGIPRDRMVLEHPSGKVLTLTDRQAIDLGFARPYDGTLDGLGKELGLSGWVSGGDAGVRALTLVKEAERMKSAAQNADRQPFLVDQNRRRRLAAKVAIERFLSLAHEWSPKLGTYSTYKETGGDWDGYWNSSQVDTGRLTVESRREWRDRTDVTVSALSKAQAGAAEMKLLEKEAQELGQPLIYPEGKLDAIREDLSIKIAFLLRNRDKHFLDDK